MKHVSINPSRLDDTVAGLFFETTKVGQAWYYRSDFPRIIKIEKEYDFHKSGQCNNITAGYLTEIELFCYHLAFTDSYHKKPSVGETRKPSSKS